MSPVSVGLPSAIRAFRSLRPHSLRLAHPRALIGLVSLLWSAPSFAQVVDTTMWVTNGTVYATERQGDLVYVGGRFTRFGPATGAGVVLNATTGEAIPPHFKIAGSVYAAVPDGSGGWFVGGAFSGVGGAAVRNLAHIAADGHVEPWTPDPDARVTALARIGGIVYAGGDFALVGEQSRARLAAIDATTGAVTAWNPGTDGGVLTLAGVGSTLYVGGYFSTVGGVARKSIAAIDASTGAVTAWDPDAGAYSVWTIRVNGDVVYLGGSFGSVGAQSRANVAAVDRVTAAVLPWDPSADREVTSICVSGSTAYLAGNFSTIGGLPRGNLAAVDATTGAVAPWDPGANGTVYDLELDGNVAIVAGSFSKVGGQTRRGLAAMDATTGSLLDWDARANDQARCVAVDADRVFVGGRFTSVGALDRNGLAAFDLATGSATGWDPNLRTVSEFDRPSIGALAVDGNTVYAAGQFDSIGAVARRRLAALDATTGVPTAWNPDPNDAVTFLALDGNTLYAAGWFTTIGGQTRQRLAALDVATASARPWDPAPNGEVTSLVMSDTQVFAAGGFTSIGGAPRMGIAALDPVSGLATGWDAASGSSVSALVLANGYLYAGGDFDVIGGQNRRHLARLDAATALCTDWVCDPDYPVTHLALAGNTLCVGGVFGQLGGQPRLFLGAADTATGSVTAWAPAVHYALGEDPVQSLRASGDRIFLGGYFSGVDGRPQSYLAAFVVDGSTPTQLALVSAEAHPDRVRLTWFASDGQGLAATVYRRTATTEWNALGPIVGDGTGRLVYEDARVEAGLRYGYRLGIRDQGREVLVGETWVEVPLMPRFALTGVRPNPAAQDLTVAFSLPDASPARLEVLDLAGRRIVARDVGALGGGSHVVRLTEGHPLAPGVYLVRLTRGDRGITVRAVIFR